MTAPWYESGQAITRAFPDAGAPFTPCGHPVSAGTPAWVRRGVRAYDPATRREGIVNGVGEPYLLEDVEEDPPTVVWLVPIGSGREWRAEINLVQPVKALTDGSAR